LQIIEEGPDVGGRSFAQRLDDRAYRMDRVGAFRGTEVEQSDWRAARRQGQVGHGLYGPRKEFVHRRAAKRLHRQASRAQKIRRSCAMLARSVAKFSGTARASAFPDCFVT